LVVGVGILASTTFQLLRDGIDSVVVAGPISGSFVFSAGLIGLLLWADLVGLPRPLARTTGIGIADRARDSGLRRRYWVSWLGILGFASLVVGIGQASGYSLVALRNFEIGAWLAVCELVFGVGALAGALLAGMRR
jgi:hypothetical protein